MNGKKSMRWALWAIATGLFFATGSPVIGSDKGLVAGARVREDSYRYFLDDMLYTHAGDDRGFGPEHDLAQANIVSLMEEFGLTVTLEPFDYSGDVYHNVVGTKLGSLYPDQEYLVGAHFDSYHNPGADDNASGVALILEAARVLNAYDADYTIRLIAFDREEQLMVGSSAYVEDHIDDNILGMITPDMVAYNEEGADQVDIHGTAASDPLKFALSEAVSAYGQGVSPSVEGQLFSDHAPFEWAGFEACHLREDGNNPNYHTPRDSVDTPGNIDYDYATRITRAVVGFLVDHAAVDVLIPTGDFDADGDVDGDDADQFFACFTGPGGAPPPVECLAGDLDPDDDIDCEDWEEFIVAWTEPGHPPEFVECTFPSPLPAPWPHGAPKNRYISFDPNNNDISVAFRIELAASAYFPGSAGTLGWVGRPEGNGVARVGDEPFFNEVWPAIVQVGDCGIVPVASYKVRTTRNGVFFSDPLELGTISQPGPKHWGDCVGEFNGTEWTAPNAEVNMDDIMAAVQKFKQLEDAPVLTWVDIDPEIPNTVLNFTDIMMIVQGFKGNPYPFSDPAECPSARNKGDGGGQKAERVGASGQE